MSYSIWKYLVYPSKTVSDKKLAAAFAGKWVVITGASSGIGEALALRLMNAGANLFLISRNEEKLSLLCARAKERGCEADFKAMDLRQR